MHFYDEPVGSSCNGGPSHRGDILAKAGAVAGIGDDGEMRQFLNDRNGVQVEQIARRRVEAAQPTLAQHHLVVAFGEDVFRAQEQIGDGGRHSALEQHRLAQTTDCLEQRVVLHVAGADLDAVPVLGHEFCPRLVHCFGHDGKPGFLASKGEQLESRFSQTLKRVRRTARLEGAAAKGCRPRRSHRVRRRQNLLLRLDRAGPRDNHDRSTADVHPGSEGDHRTVRFPLARHLLVLLGDVNHLRHARKADDVRVIHPGVVPNQADHRALLPRHGNWSEAHFGDDATDCVDLGVGRAVLHDDKHYVSSKSIIHPSDARTTRPSNCSATCASISTDSTGG